MARVVCARGEKSFSAKAEIWMMVFKPYKVGLK